MNYRNKQATKSLINIQNFLPEIAISKTRLEIIHGLFQNNKTISSKFFYDQKGSELFVDITNLPEYYPTKTEISILAQIPNEVLNKKNQTFIELGSGDSSKISILLNKIDKLNIATTTYMPVDISEKAIQLSSVDLQNKFPQMKINAIIEDFMSQLHLIPDIDNKVFCFFGSTLGNLSHAQAVKFLQNISDVMNKNDRLFLGIDLLKNIKIIESAYNDKTEITAKFNKNILNNINNIIESDFKSDDFEHLAFFNHEKKRIEMHLKAKHDLTVKSPFFDKDLIFIKNETIHTENSHKFTEKLISDIVSKSNLKISNKFFDKKKWFSILEIIK